MITTSINRNSLIGEKAGVGYYNKNIVLSKKTGTIANEDSHLLIDTIVDYTVIGKIELGQEYILFVIDNTDNCKILYYNSDNTRQVIIADFLLGFTKENPIKGVGYFNNKQEIVIVWWDGITTTSKSPKILNINCLPFELDVNKKLINPNDIKLLELFPIYNNCKINLVNVEHTGKLRSGAYIFSMAYVFPDGSTTSFFNFTNPVYIVRDNLTKPETDFSGVEGDVLTNQSIRLRIDNVDKSYSKIRIGIISRKNGIETAGFLEDIVISSDVVTILFENNEDLIDSSLESIIIPKEHYAKVNRGVALNDRLYLADVIKHEIPKIQQYVNNIKLNWVREDSISLSSNISSYRDNLFLFNKKGFKAGEVYAFYLIINTIFGDTWAYHIPGKIAGNYVLPDTTPDVEDSTLDYIFQNGYDAGNVDYAQALLVNKQGIFSKIIDTSSETTMGYWENEDEHYEDTECNDIKNSTGTVVGSLRNLTIKHHKFPTIAKLRSLGNEFITESGIVAGGAFATAKYDRSLGSEFIKKTSDYYAVYDKTVTNNSALGVWQNDQSRYVANVHQDITISVKYHLSNIDDDYFTKIIHYNASLTPIVILHSDKVNTTPIINVNKTYDFEGVWKVVLNPGEVVEFSDRLTGNSDPNGTIEISISNDNSEVNAIAGKILGIKISDVFIPDELKPYITSWQVGYAERTPANTTRVGQANLFGDAVSDVTHNFRSHPFDILNFKTNVDIDFVDINFKNTDNHSALGEGELRYFKTLSTVTGIAKIEESILIPSDVNTPIMNTHGEELLYIKSNRGFDDHVHVDFCVYKRNVYTNRYNQNIIIIPNKFTADEIVSDNLYGGDIHLNTYGYFVATDVVYTDSIATERKDTRPYVSFVESISNIGFRYGNIFNNEIFPKRDLKLIELTANPVTYNSYTQYIGYNEDYNSMTNFLNIEVFNCNTGCVNEPIIRFNGRIIRSVVQGNERKSIDWRTFHSSDYYEMPKHRKGIVALKVFNNVLMIQCEEGLFFAVVKDKISTDNQTSYLGYGDLFDRIPEEVLYDEVGTVGCLNEHSIHVSVNGYFVVDVKQGKIFLYDGKIKEISALGLFDYFKDNLYLFNQDNPYNGNGIISAFNKRDNMILLTLIKRLDDAISNSSITWSFCFETMQWLAQHEYLPSFYVRTREYLFSGYNNIAEQIVTFYRHNNPLTKARFNGVQKRSYIEYTIRTEKGNSIIWSGVVWESFIQQNANIFYNDEISAIVVYNDIQCTGEIPIIYNNKISDKGTARQVDYITHFNNLFDIVVNNQLPFLDDKGELLTSNLNYNKKWFNEGKIRSSFIVIRLIISNTNSKDVYIKNINAK